MSREEIGVRSHGQRFTIARSRVKLSIDVFFDLQTYHKVKLCEISVVDKCEVELIQMIDYCSELV